MSLMLERMDFNEVNESYRDDVNRAVGFVGKDLDFFTAVKADCLRRIIRQQIRNVKRPRVLDIGCGHGFIHRLLHDSGFDMVGVDVATKVLRLARESNPEVSYASYDGNALPFGSQTFDVVFAICVMHHVLPADWNAFLLEMKRVMTAKGIAIVFEHNPYNPLTRYVVASNDIDRDAVLLSSLRLKKLMVQSGFRTPETRFILFSPFAHPFFRWLDGKLGWCPIGAQYYATARQ